MKYSIDVTINVTDVDEPHFAPVFTEGTSTTRSVAENPASGQNIGAAVTATDANMSDTLTYTLGGMDAADFGIVPSSGQLQTSAALVFETKDSYAVTVSVSDGNGGADSIDVTINVTADRAALVALYNATGGANWTTCPLGGHSSIVSTKHFPVPNQPICPELTSSRFPHFVVSCCFFLVLSIR